jgi:hypothetical protein
MLVRVAPSLCFGSPQVPWRRAQRRCCNIVCWQAAGTSTSYIGGVVRGLTFVSSTKREGIRQRRAPPAAQAHCGLGNDQAGRQARPRGSRPIRVCACASQPEGSACPLCGAEPVRRPARLRRGSAERARCPAASVSQAVATLQPGLICVLRLPSSHPDAAQPSLRSCTRPNRSSS